MVRRHVIRHEVEDEIDAALEKLFTGSCKACGTSKMRVNFVAPDGIGGSDVIGGLKIRESFSEAFE